MLKKVAFKQINNGSDGERWLARQQTLYVARNSSSVFLPYRVKEISNKDGAGFGSEATLPAQKTHTKRNTEAFFLGDDQKKGVNLDHLLSFKAATLSLFSF